MSGVSRLVPVGLSAKRVTDATPVPTLNGAAFSRDQLLEPGVHLHWALPDALVRAHVVGTGSSAPMFFPAVPDLWLVLRFQPVLPGALRRWRGWIVDSFTQQSVPLPEWVRPARDAERVLTAVGVLPSATRDGRPGWGRFGAQAAAMDLSSVAYYPSVRDRFGFHDPLDDLADAAGRISYTVVGWYLHPESDPLASASHLQSTLVDRKLALHAKTTLFDVIGTRSNTTPPGQMLRAWRPRSLEVAGPLIGQPQHVAAAEAALKLKGFDHWHNQQIVVAELFPAGVASGAYLTDGIAADAQPQLIVCHGSVFGVELQAAAVEPAAFESHQVNLYPSVKRATAEVAASSRESRRLDAIEMLLQGLDAKRQATSEIVDLPGAVHELTFQSAHGRGTLHARLDVWPGTSRQAIPAALLSEPESMPHSQPMVAAWIARVREALEAALAGAEAMGRTLNPRLVHVHDHRRSATPARIGPTASGDGPDQAGWWLDVQSEDELRALLRGAAGTRIHLPDAANLYEIPGARWHRPWAPALVLAGAKRSYRFGFDDRFSDNGVLLTRLAGEFLAAFTVSNLPQVIGRDLLDDPDGLRIAGLPASARPLAGEAQLLDADNAMLMAVKVGRPAAASIFAATVRSLWLLRNPDLRPDLRATYEQTQRVGLLPSPIALSAWSDLRDPVFIDVHYTYRPLPIESDWQLEVDRIECTRRAGSPLQVPQAIPLRERVRVTHTVTKALASQTGAAWNIGANGEMKRHQLPPSGLHERTFTSIDLLSASLVALDPALLQHRLTERAGVLQLERFDLIDTFGTARPWQGPGEVPEPVAEPFVNLPSYATQLHPRLPYWARLRLRLHSAADPTREASATDSPIIGILVPDFVEHALEVYDASGTGIGQMSASRPLERSTEARVLRTHFDMYPWVRSELQLAADADPLDAIAHPVLRQFVASVLAHETVVPPDVPGWYETALTALMRIVDTVRGTLDPGRAQNPGPIRLIGEPILLLAAQVRLDATTAEAPADMADDAPAAPEEPAMPTLTVRIGDATRPDDGVIGCFIAAPAARDARFIPVDPQARSGAIVNPLSDFTTQRVLPVDHPFVVSDRGCTFSVGVQGKKDLVILAEACSGLYATVGALPRKRISLPHEWWQDVVKRVAPALKVGPILTSGPAQSPHLPAIRLARTTRTEFIETVPDPAQAVPASARALQASNPQGELPLRPCTLSRGWIRVSPDG